MEAQQSSLTALTAPLEEECDRSGDKECFAFVVTHTLSHVSVLQVSVHLTSDQWHGSICMMLLIALKHMESNILFWLAIHVWQDVQGCWPESLIDFWCLGGQGSKGKEEDWPKISNKKLKNNDKCHSSEKVIWKRYYVFMKSIKKYTKILVKIIFQKKLTCMEWKIFVFKSCCSRFLFCKTHFLRKRTCHINTNIHTHLHTHTSQTREMSVWKMSVLSVTKSFFKAENYGRYSIAEHLSCHVGRY